MWCLEQIVEDYLPTCTSSMTIKNWPWICWVRNLVFSTTRKAGPWLKISWRCFWRRHTATEPLWRFCQELSKPWRRGSRARWRLKTIWWQQIWWRECISAFGRHSGGEVVNSCRFRGWFVPASYTAHCQLRVEMQHDTYPIVIYKRKKPAAKSPVMDDVV